MNETVRVKPCSVRTRARKSRMSGFTMPEVILAMIVFTGMLLMFAAAMPSLTRTAQYDSTYTQATAVCQHKIEELRDSGYGKLTYAILKTSQDLDGRYLADQTNGLDTPNSAAPTSSTMRFEVQDELVTRADGTKGFFPAGTQGEIIIQHDYAAFTKLVTVRISWPASGGKAAGNVTVNAFVTSAPYLLDK